MLWFLTMHPCHLLLTQVSSLGVIVLSHALSCTQLHIIPPLGASALASHHTKHIPVTSHQLREWSELAAWDALGRQTLNFTVGQLAFDHTIKKAAI